MKNVSLILALLTITAPSFSQVEKTSVPLQASGSGNGNLDRDILNYEAQLDDAQLNLISLEEAFEKLKEELKKMTSMTIPTYAGTPTEFWIKLTEKDQQHLKKVDEELIQTVTSQISNISAIKERIASTQATINALAKEIPRYEERGISKEFKKLLEGKKVKLKFQIQKDLSDIFIGVEKPIKTIKRYNYSLKYATYPYQDHFKKCESAICADILLNKLNTYVDTVSELSQVKVKLLDLNSNFSFLAYDSRRYNFYAKSHKLDMKRIYFTELNSLNERAIKALNN